MIDRMVAAAAENGLTDPQVAREVCNNVVAALEGDATVREVTSMIRHRQFHWPQLWLAFHGSPDKLARALVRAYKETSR